MSHWWSFLADTWVQGDTVFNTRNAPATLGFEHCPETCECGYDADWFIAKCNKAHLVAFLMYMLIKSQ